MVKYKVWDKALKIWTEDYCAGTHAFTETYISLSGDVVKFSAGFPEKDEQPLFSKDSDDYFHNGKFHRTEDRYVVCRGTGLFYKNGDEAFEGDIFNTMPARYKIVFKNGAFYCEWLMGLNPNKDILLFNLIDNAIPLGNINESNYEN